MYVITEYPTLAVSLIDVKNNLNIENDYTNDDNLLTRLIKVYAKEAQEFLNYFVGVHEINHKSFASGNEAIKLYAPNPSNIVVKKYVDNTLTGTVSDTLYHYDIYTRTLIPNDNWEECDYMILTYNVGEAEINARIKDYIIARVTHAYDNRHSGVMPDSNMCHDMIRDLKEE